MLDAEKKHFCSIGNTFQLPVREWLLEMWIAEERVYLRLWRKNECLTSPGSAAKRASCASSQCSSGSVSARCQDHRGKTQVRANQHGLRSAAGLRCHPSAQHVCRSLARETRHQRTDLAEFRTCRYRTRFMNARGESFVLEAVFFARQGRPQVAISDLDFRFCRPDDRTRECTRPVREKLSR